MAKLTIQFEILFPLRKKKIENMQLRHEDLGDLVLQGSFEKRNGSITSANIDFVRLKGVDIRPAMESFGLMEDLEEFCLAKAGRFIQNGKEVSI